MVKVNGQAAPDAAGGTLNDYLSRAGYDPARIAVERNGEIVPRAQYAEQTLRDGDNLEIVGFVGGG